MTTRQIQLSRFAIPIKRVVDLAIAIPTLILLLPLLFGVAILILVTDGSPIFFRQTRPGRFGRPFSILKFRSMRKQKPNELSSDADRLTLLGSWLRGTSIDELPELWNIIAGDMSLVGPRPLLMEYLPLYSSEQNRRHEVRPGLTGWAQINGRNAISWEEKFALDIWYVDHQSFFLDLKILCLTMKKVLKREAIAASGHSTMPMFEGPNHDPDKQERF